MKDNGGWRVPDKFELLAASYKCAVDHTYGDDAEPFAGIVIGVLRDLHDNADGHIPDADLADAIYSRLAHAEGVDFDDDPELDPGQYDPASGEHNPETPEEYEARKLTERPERGEVIVVDPKKQVKKADGH